MSEIHIYDPQVRPESLCGYTGDPGEGEPTCAACVAVDEHLVYPSARWDTIRDRVVVPAIVVAGLVMGGSALIGQLWLAWVAGVAISLLIVVGVPATLVVENFQVNRRRGELIETEA